MPVFKQYISIPEVKETIVRIIQNNAMLADILRDKSTSPYHRYYMAERYSLFVRMVYDPNSVDGWSLMTSEEKVRDRTRRILFLKRMSKGKRRKRDASEE